MNLHQTANPLTTNKTPVINKSVKVPQEEPTTEVKRVPYRITDNQEGDMFEDFSCSSEFDKMQQIQVGDGLLGGMRAGNQLTMSFNLNIAPEYKQ